VHSALSVDVRQIVRTCCVCCSLISPQSTEQSLQIDTQQEMNQYSLDVSTENACYIACQSTSLKLQQLYQLHVALLSQRCRDASCLSVVSFHSTTGLADLNRGDLNH